ncbi:MAG: tetratricopeptide repeat protein, partial [Anaerolineae bacterium]
VKLFLSAARRAWPGYELTLSGDILSGIIRICRLVEGMPLGILLAASWVQVLPVTEIADQIAQSLDFLATELSDVPDRHRSMRAVLDHSWVLLTSRERDAMQRLSVFRGSFVRESAQQVAGVSLPELRALINKSLLHFQPPGRYHIHELVRQYAGERLAQSPADAEAAADRHCAWYTDALQHWAADLRGPRQQDALAEMDAEIENARAAWEWAVTSGLVPQLAQALDGFCYYYQRRGRLEEGNAACQAVSEKLQSTANNRERVMPDTGSGLLSRALTWQGLFTRLTGYAEAAGPLLDRSIALLDALDSPGQDVQAQRAFALLEMGRQAFDLDRDHARRCLEQCLDLYQALGDRWGAAETLYMLGFLADGLGGYDRARQLLNKSLAIRQVLGDQQGMAQSLVLLGLIALRIGQLEQGEALLRQSIGQLRELGERVDLADGLHYLGFATFLQGRFEEGIVLQEECLALADDLALGHPRGMALHALGNYYAMLGKYEKARTYATSGLAHARTLSDAYVIGSTCLVLGLISLAQQDYGSGQRWFEQSLAAYRGIGQQDGQSWSRACLGEALQIGVSVNSFLSTILALSGFALWMARTDEVERAVELWALLSRYPLVSNAPFFQDIVGRFIDAAAVDLPPEMVASARERGMAGDLYAMAKAFLS